jgi:Flp pilus assembly protein TadG
MNRHSRKKHSQRGVATVEFALTASVFIMMIVGIISGAHLFFTHNAIVEATRRGARYAATQCKPNLAGCPNSAGTIERVQNVVLYGTPEAGTTTLVHNLQRDNVTVTYSSDYGVAAGNVSVKIDNYSYIFAVSRTSIAIPKYQTTLIGESAGFIPGQFTCP